MKIESFVNKDIGISGVVPEGWVEKSPGEFSRGASNADPTILVQQGIPGLTIEQLKTLLLPQLGIDKFPKSVGSIRNVNLTWDLYAAESIELDRRAVKGSIALAQAEAWAYVVLLVATSDEYDDLHYAVFLRAVDALVPTSTERVEERAIERKKTVREVGADILLVKDERLENHACDVVADILGTGLGLGTEFVELEALGEMDFQGVKLLFIPGGECASIRLSERASHRVQAAVASGMGYMGICCGAFLAAEASTMAFHWHIGGRSFGIFPGLAEAAAGEGVWPFYIDVCHPIISNSSVAHKISPAMRMKFVGGTSNLMPSYERGLQNWCVATLDEPSNREAAGKRAAMTATVFGKGRVFLSGPHPEAQKDTHPILLAAAEWCTHRSDPESDQPPLVEANIPVEGIANQSFVCSATGSRDPHGFPAGFIWDFGDGSPKQHRPEAIHIYRNPGRYTVILTVTTGTRHSTKPTETIIREP